MNFPTQEHAKNIWVLRHMYLIVIIYAVITDCSRVDSSQMGSLCGIGFMGAPAVVLEKLIGGEETHLALTRLRQLLASGATGKTGDDRVRVSEKTCSYFDGSSFPTSMASEEDLKEIDLSFVGLPLVSV